MSHYENGDLLLTDTPGLRPRRYWYMRKREGNSLISRPKFVRGCDLLGRLMIWVELPTRRLR